MTLLEMVPSILLAIVVVTVSAPTSLLASSKNAKPGCQEQCGNLTIPFPFGVSPGCYLNEDFLITCNITSGSASLRKSNIGVSNISMEDGELQAMQYIASDCYSISGPEKGFDNEITISKFSVSSTKNKFTAIGCDTVAYIQGTSPHSMYGSGCISICDGPEYITNGSCSGIGCCQTPIPPGLRSFNVSLSSVNNHTSILSFNPCSYAFVVQQDKFNFSLSTFMDFQSVEKLPLVLDWAIGNLTCDETRASSPQTYACTENSECVDVANVPGYRCNCSEGYQGNPYLSNGCQDKDECQDPNNLCVVPEHCVNEPGSYSCSCPKGYHGDGRKNGEGCVRDQLPLILMALCMVGGITLIFLGIFWLYFGAKKRELIRLRQKLFQQIGGLLLQEKLSGHRGSKDKARVFSEDELKRATNNFDESRIIGKGDFGTVYKGILTTSDGTHTVVAIKKSKIVDQDQVEQFINELVLQSRIDHRNVVKLLGCCLETRVPLLVYEYISNGTLYDHIHNHMKAVLLSWDIRVKIAAETAGVLSYLHSDASTPIIHRDMKPTNILLDENCVAKVSDFGASRLVPSDQNELCIMVQGTLGYMDPEYMCTSELTDKSDVYSFGVVLVELLTGKKALCFERPEKERNLAMWFLSSIKDESQWFEIADEHLVLEDDHCRDQFRDVADLAVRCLRVKGEERPSMKEVAMKLEGILMGSSVVEKKRSWENVNLNVEEIKYLLVENSSDMGHASNSESMSGYDSMRQHVVLPLESGR